LFAWVKSVVGANGTVTTEALRRKASKLAKLQALRVQSLLPASPMEDEEDAERPHLL
jgi:hypothetical protein